MQMAAEELQMTLERVKGTREKIKKMRWMGGQPRAIIEFQGRTSRTAQKVRASR